MAIGRTELLRRLDELGIAHATVEHRPVATVEEAERHTGQLPGGHCKNLFLKDRKGSLWLPGSRCCRSCPGTKADAIASAPVSSRVG